MTALCRVIQNQQGLEFISLYGSQLSSKQITLILRSLRESATRATLKELRLSPCQFNSQESCEELASLVAGFNELERLEISGQRKAADNIRGRDELQDRRVKVQVQQASFVAKPGSDGSISVYDPDLKQAVVMGMPTRRTKLIRII